MNHFAVVTHRGAGLLVALGTALALAACGDTAEPASDAASSAESSPAAAPTGYDISRIDAVQDDFPPGFTAEAHPAKTLAQADIDGSGINAFTKAVVDPPQCRSLIIPPYTEPSVGSQAAGVLASGDQGNMYVIALRSAQPVAVSQPPAGCDRVSLSGSPEASGTAERIPGPSIDGVATTGVKLTGNSGDPDYLFTAALDDRTSVVVMGSADAQLDPQQLMSNLLVKATSAVRG